MILSLAKVVTCVTLWIQPQNMPADAADIGELPVSVAAMKKLQRISPTGDLFFHVCLSSL